MCMLCERPQSAESELKGKENHGSSRLLHFLAAWKFRAQAPDPPFGRWCFQGSLAVEPQGCCSELIAQGNYIPSAPCWRLCNPKRALAMTNKAVKEAPTSKKIHSLKEYDFNDFSVGASLPFKPQALSLSEIPVFPCCVLQRP